MWSETLFDIKQIQPCRSVADPNLSITLLVQILDFFGTIAFAVTGAFKAIEHTSNIVSIVILSTITGGAGVVIRDIAFGKFPRLLLSILSILP